MLLQSCSQQLSVLQGQALRCQRRSKRSQVRLSACVAACGASEPTSVPGSCFSVTTARSLSSWLHLVKYRHPPAGLIRIAPPCLQKSNDVCSQYRKWLSAVSECTKALTASKTRLEEAKKDMAEREEDLNILVNEAGTFMQKEQARAAKRAKRHAQRCAGWACKSSCRVELGARARPLVRCFNGEALWCRSVLLSEVLCVLSCKPSCAACCPDRSETSFLLWCRDDGQAGNGVAEGDEGMGPQEVPDGADDVAEKFKPGIKFRLAA